MTGDGCSGRTYQQGLVLAAKKTKPSLIFYENVVTVANATTDKETGEKFPPLVQAGQSALFRAHAVYIER